MPFIGNQPAESYSAFQKQDFSTSATTSYTLDNPVANANELALFINFVRQEPTTAYSASGTSLTLTSATASSDDMYCVYLGKAVQTVNPPNASVGLSQLTASGTKNSTTFLRGDNTFAVAGGTNTPAFKANQASAQNLSNNANTVIIFETEVFDTDSDYDTSTGRFTPSVAGKYFFHATVRLDDSLDNKRFNIAIYKNSTNSAFFQHRQSGNDLDNSVQISAILEANGSSDYFFIQCFQEEGGTTATNGDAKSTYFSGYKIIE